MYDSPMGAFTHETTLAALYDGASDTLEAVVDTGATFTSVPAPILERMGVAPDRVVRLRLANGRLEERDIGEVRIELDGVAGGIICVFGDPDSPPIIGAHTLEGFLLFVDPVQQRLVPVEGYWLQGLGNA